MTSTPRRTTMLPSESGASQTPPPPDLLSGSPQADYAAFDDVEESALGEETLRNSNDSKDRRKAMQRNDSLDNLSVHLTDSTRPTSLGEFFRDFWSELKSLILELIDYGRKKTWKKKLMTIFLMVSSALVFYDLIFGSFIISHLEDFINWMTLHPSYAVVAFVSIFVVCTLIMIPPAILIFGAGFAFAQAIGFYAGVVAAIFSCFIGSCIGAVIAFLRSRYMMRDLIYLFSRRYPLVKATDRALKRNGFHIMLLLRLCPLIPFNGLNYCCGITGVKLESFVFSLIGILPFQIYTVIVGATTGRLTLSANGPDHNNESQHLGWTVLIASGCAFGVIALVYTWKLVKKELRKELDITEEQLLMYLHPEEIEREQGGIESSIEVSHIEGTAGAEWSEKGEEWFWIWA